MGVAAKAADQRVVFQLLVQAAAQVEHGAVDNGANAAHTLNVSGALHLAQRVPDHGTADTEFRGQIDLGGQAVFVKNGEARLADGVIAGSTLVLHRAIHNMITLAKMPPETVIPMATSTPADSVGAKGYGRIEPGACGVLTLMDAGWNLAGVTA